MINLVIGKPLFGLSNTYTIKNIFEGLSYLEHHKIKFIVMNIDDVFLSEKEISRVFRLLKAKKIPTLIVSNQVNFDKFEIYDYISVLRSKDLENSFEQKYDELLKYKTISNQIKEISKHKKTAPLYTLACLLILEPLIKIAYLKFSTGFSFETVFEIIFSIDSPVKNIEFWLLFPLAGLALIRSSSYSLFTFFGVNIYSIYAFVSYEKFSWPYVQESPHISSSILISMNILLVAYLMIPENRRPFVEKARDLFRKSQRINVFKESEMKINNLIVNITIMNISETGVMVSLSKQLDNSKDISLSIGGELISCRVVREIDTLLEAKLYTYGLKFKFENSSEHEIFSDYLDELKREISTTLKIA